MVKGVVKRKATPSSLRRKKAQQRIRKKIAVKAAKKKPSWKASLKNQYLKKKTGSEAEDATNGKKRKRYENGEEGDEVQDDIDEDKMKRLNERNPLATQLFLKHLPFDTNEAELLDLLKRYGAVQRVFLTRSHATKQLTGTGFVHCGTEEIADVIMNFATQNARELSSSTKEDMKKKTEAMSHHQAKKLQFKLRGDTVEVRDPFILVRDTRVTVHRVLSRTDSQEASSQNALNNNAKKKKKITSVAGDDPRNLYLLQEGRIEPGTSAAKGLPERYVQLLGQDYEQRRQMLKDTNMFVSKTRLNVRNLPKKYTDRDVRKLFSDQARIYLKKNKQDMEKEKWGKYGPIKNVKLLADGNGVSKGYAFVEFINHNVALNVLRMLNNNPTLFGEQNRLVVSFAIENINAIQKLARIREIRQQKSATSSHAAEE